MSKEADYKNKSKYDIARELNSYKGNNKKLQNLYINSCAENKILKRQNELLRKKLDFYEGLVKERRNFKNGFRAGNREPKKEQI